MKEQRENCVWPLFLSFVAALSLSVSQAFAACSGRPGNAGDIVYSSASTIMMYCNGTSWVAMGLQGTTSAP